MPRKEEIPIQTSTFSVPESPVRADMAQALYDSISQAADVAVMGHHNPDMDSLGAAAGIAAICRRIGSGCHILQPATPCAADPLYQQLFGVELYQDRFQLPSEASLTPDTLLLIVDANRPEMVMCPALLEKASRIAVIDHHVPGDSQLERTDLRIQDTAVSSTSELVCDVLRCFLNPEDLLPAEADALLSGIMLDTRNFTKRTTAETFATAAFLIQAGGDPGRVQKMLQTSREDVLARHHIVEQARMFRQGVSIAVSTTPVNPISAAQAADELLTIEGTGASFVLYPFGNTVRISARSTDGTDVQKILAQLGGGGSKDAAGAQLPNVTLAAATADLERAIRRFTGGPT